MVKINEDEVVEIKLELVGFVLIEIMIKHPNDVISERVPDDDKNITYKYNLIKAIRDKNIHTRFRMDGTVSPKAYIIEATEDGHAIVEFDLTDRECKYIKEYIINHIGGYING